MVQLFGRITKDATVTEVKGEKKVVNFTIALNDSYKPKEGEVVKTTAFVNCAYWLNPANADYLTKGKLVEVNGRLSAGAYLNQQGEAVGTLNFHVNNFKLYGKGNEDAKSAADAAPSGKGKKKPAKTPADVTEPTDDLPF